MDTTGKVALVTGAAMRVGREIALALAKTGMHIAVHYRSSAGPALETVERVRALKVEAESIQADLDEFRQIKQLIESVRKRWGRLDV
ncbi:MAG: SDR family NAD(P)-dependent oxidoreductase, partial [Gemmatimonadetes bacterium]|nr:SDR family NAD(P)-dependent oxidoreductase [Gemmatimonadota bacterium]